MIRRILAAALLIAGLYVVVLGAQGAAADQSPSAPATSTPGTAVGSLTAPLGPETRRERSTRTGASELEKCLARLEQGARVEDGTTASTAPSSSTSTPGSEIGEGSASISDEDCAQVIEAAL